MKLSMQTRVKGRIVVYTDKNNEKTRGVRVILRGLSLPFLEVHIDDYHYVLPWLESTTGCSELPQIFINGNYIGTYEVFKVTMENRDVLNRLVENLVTNAPPPESELEIPAPLLANDTPRYTKYNYKNGFIVDVCSTGSDDPPELAYTPYMQSLRTMKSAEQTEDSGSKKFNSLTPTKSRTRRMSSFSHIKDKNCIKAYLQTIKLMRVNGLIQDKITGWRRKTIKEAFTASDLVDALMNYNYLSKEQAIAAGNELMDAKLIVRVKKERNSLALFDADKSLFQIAPGVGGVC